MSSRIHWCQSRERLPTTCGEGERNGKMCSPARHLLHRYRLTRVLPYTIVVVAMTGCDPQAPLVEAMRSGDMEVRANAVDQLSFLNQRVSDEAIDAAIELLKDKEEWVRDAAIDSLGRIGNPRAIGPLIKVLTDPEEDDYIRSSAALALGRFQEQSAVQALTEAFLDEHSALMVKCDAAVALGKTRHETAPHVLLEAFAKTGTTEEDECVRRSIVFGLGHTRRKETVPPLLAIMNAPENSDRLRATAAVSLGRTTDKTAVKRLLSAARDETLPRKVRNAAAVGLVLSGDPAGLDYVFSALSEGPNWHICGCALAIGQIRDRHAVPRLIEALKHPCFDVRYWAVQALGELQDPRATEALEELLSEENEDLRCRIRQSLAHIDGTLEWQERIVTDTDWRLGEAQCEVLGP